MADQMASKTITLQTDKADITTTTLSELQGDKQQNYHLSSKTMWKRTNEGQWQTYRIMHKRLSCIHSIGHRHYHPSHTTLRWKAEHIWEHPEWKEHGRSSSLYPFKNYLQLELLWQLINEIWKQDKNISKSLLHAETNKARNEIIMK